MYSVTESISFSYGHRLMDYEGACGRLHGHNGRVEITVRADDLDRRGMVVDFAEILEVARGWIEANLDHRMLLRRDDPLVRPLQAQGEPLLLMDDNPTAEAIAKLVHDAVTAQGLRVAEVRLWETESAVASYSGGG